MGVSEKQLVSFAGWPAGIDNLSQEQALKRDDQGKTVIAVRDASNVDLDRAGKAMRREGRALVLAGSRTHSLWRRDPLPFALLAVDGVLTGMHANGDSFAIGPLRSPALPISFELAGDRVFWSNGDELGCVASDGAPLPWGCPAARFSPTLAPIIDSGGLDAGRYQVAVTWRSVTGEEGGASIASTVDVPAGGGIRVSGLPDAEDPDVAQLRLYVSGPNGDVLYHAADVTAGLPVATIGAGERGKALATMLLERPPAGHIVRLLNGRMLIAAGATLVWTEALRYGLTQLAKNRLRFSGRLAMVQPVGAGGDGPGVYVADGKRTYWLGGPDPAQWSQVIASPFSAVPGSAMAVPAASFGLEVSGEVAYWVSSSGVAILGLPGGQVLPLRADQVVSPAAESAASMYRERRGMRQVVTAMRGTSPRGLALGDSAVVSVERYDDL